MKKIQNLVLIAILFLSFTSLFSVKAAQTAYVYTYDWTGNTASEDMSQTEWIQLKDMKNNTDSVLFASSLYAEDMILHFATDPATADNTYGWYWAENPLDLSTGFKMRVQKTDVISRIVLYDDDAFLQSMGSGTITEILQPIINLLDPAILYHANNRIALTAPISVLKNTDYSFTFPMKDCYEHFEDNSYSMTFNIDGDTAANSIIDLTVTETNYESGTTPIYWGENGTATVHFNTGNNTSINILIESAEAEPFLNSWGYYQLELGTKNREDGDGEEVAYDINLIPVVEEPPVITLDFYTLTLEYGAAFIGAYPTATDSEGNIFHTGFNVVMPVQIGTDPVTGIYSPLGTYYIYYDFTDANGLAAEQQVLTVTVVDTTAPVITLNGAENITLVIGQSYTERGATITDNYITNNLFYTAPATVSGTVDTATLGTYTITYSGTDESGNAATEITRTVTVVENPDTEAPVITLTGGEIINLNYGQAYTELGATWTDDTDGSGAFSVSSATAAVISNLDINTAGTYTITYAKTDAAGNISIPVVRTVIVAAEIIPDTEAPVVTLNGDSTVYVVINETYTELGAIFTDNVDGTGPAVVEGDVVDTSTLGTYVVTYAKTDAAGNEAAAVTRTVIVTEPAVVAPVIPSNNTPGLFGIPWYAYGVFAIMGVLIFGTKKGRKAIGLKK